VRWKLTVAVALMTDDTRQRLLSGDPLSFDSNLPPSE
jgi:hypothetical protein